MITENSIRESIEASGVNVVKEAGFVSIKSASDTIVSPAPGVIQFAGRDGGAPRPLRVRDLIPTVQATSGSIGYFTTTRTGAPTSVAEDGAKPQMSFSSELVTRPLITFAGITKVTEECASDYPTLVDRFQNDADDALYDLIDSQIVSGNGQTGQLAGLASVLPAGSTTHISSALAQLLQGGYTPDGIIVTTSMLASLLSPTSPVFSTTTVPSGTPIDQASELVTQLVAGHPTLVAGAIQFGPLRILGLPVAVIPGGTGVPQIIVGDFRHSTRLYTTGVERQVGRDDVDFSHDRITLRSSERVALAILDAGGLRRASIN